jgi:hypothetical protein
MFAKAGRVCALLFLAALAALSGACSSWGKKKPWPL